MQDIVHQPRASPRAKFADVHVPIFHLLFSRMKKLLIVFSAVISTIRCTPVVHEDSLLNNWEIPGDIQISVHDHIAPSVTGGQHPKLPPLPWRDLDAPRSPSWLDSLSSASEFTSSFPVDHGESEADTHLGTLDSTFKDLQSALRESAAHHFPALQPKQRPNRKQRSNLTPPLLNEKRIRFFIRGISSEDKEETRPMVMIPLDRIHSARST